MTSIDERTEAAEREAITEDDTDAGASAEFHPRLLPRSIVPTARFAYHAWHYARWSWRFGAFGFGSTLGKPRIAFAHYPNVFLGRGVHISPVWRLEAFHTMYGRSYPARIEIGDGTVADIGFHIGATDLVEVGRDVLISSWVLLAGANRVLRDELPPRHLPLDASAPLRIGDGCWLGERCVILSGVELGERCVVGANAVVTKSFPAYSIVGGNPARLIGSCKPES